MLEYFTKYTGMKKVPTNEAEFKEMVKSMVEKKAGAAIGDAGEKATQAALSAAMDAAEDAKKFLKQNQLRKFVDVDDKQIDAMIEKAKGVVSATGARLEGIFTKLKMGGSAQEAKDIICLTNSRAWKRVLLNNYDALPSAYQKVQN